MHYTANKIARNCVIDNCECKNCSFNGIEGMCIGCNECLEHKQLAPVSNCNIIKKGDWHGFCAVQLNGSYMICIPMGICDIPEYFNITKEEFDTFEEWKNSKSKIIEIEVRENIRSHK